ncbi:MAG: TlpA family protein disulfide reductase [Gemmatimonadaceae bacterium]
MPPDRLEGMKYATILLNALFLVLHVDAVGGQESGIPVGTRAPSALVKTLDGKPVDIGSWVGKVPIVIEFWASWCSSCKELESTFAAMERKYGSRLKFIGVAVSVSQSPERVKAYTTKYKYRHETLFDTDGQATEAYDVPGTSYVVVVNRKGTVVYTGIGGRQNLEPAILKALSD